jgi:hypothetical protein
MVMAQAKKASQSFITGTFTPTTDGETITISFGQKVERYIAFIGLNAASRTALGVADLQKSKAYEYLGYYKWNSVGQVEFDSKNGFCYVAYNGTNDSTGNGSCNMDSITDEVITKKAYTADSNRSADFLVGYTYEYTIVPITENNNFITGSITPQATGTTTINFGKSLDRYLFLLEMNAASRTALSEAGISNWKVYGMLGISHWDSIGQVDYTAKTVGAARYNGGSSEINFRTQNILSISSNSIGIDTVEFNSSNSSGGLFVGKTYDYMIIPF